MDNRPESPDRGYMGDPRRGASLGRPTLDGGFVVLDNARPFTLRKVRIDSQGYDKGGAYWGVGPTLYYFEGPVSDISGYVRGSTREAAKDAVRKLHPKARFYR